MTLAYLRLISRARMKRAQRRPSDAFFASYGPRFAWKHALMVNLDLNYAVTSHVLAARQHHGRYNHTYSCYPARAHFVCLVRGARCPHRA